MPNIDLQNRIARKMLEAFLAYFREFRDTGTTVDPDQFGLTAAEFMVVANRLNEAGLVEFLEEEEDTCFATRDGLEVAGDPEKIDALFPVAGDPSAPLPSELKLFGKRPVEPAAHVPSPMDWEEYRLHLHHVWPRLLNSESQIDEAAFQRFLEKHPCLLPDAYTCFGRGATPHKHAYFTEPELPGFRAKRPDFMTIMFDSDAVVVLLIEIEAPAKPWATSTGVPSAKLTQALDQLREWKVWFREPENVIQFTKTYEIDARLLETHQLLQRYVLIYGRRDEANANPVFAKKRALIAQTDEALMTFDRLSPSSRMNFCPTVGIDRSSTGSKFSAVHVPPTFRLGTYNADQLSRVSGLRDAILKNELMSKERREFLLARCSYWEDWSRKTPVISDWGIDQSEYYME